MTKLEQTIRELTPHLYEEHREMLRFPLGFDMAHSNQCQHLTFDMMEALQHRDLPVRREYHRDEDGFWHYLLAHPLDIGTPPAESDIVTDLNPWQYTGDYRLAGPIHAPRHELMQVLRQSKAPEWFVALRSLETVIAPHQQHR